MCVHTSQHFVLRSADTIFAVETLPKETFKLVLVIRLNLLVYFDVGALNTSSAFVSFINITQPLTIKSLHAI